MSNPEETQQIEDAGDLRKYRIELPNMADDDLAPFEFRLYAHYKRVCGGHGNGVCWESVRTTATKTKMSVGQVSKSRDILLRDGWILVTTNPRTRTKSIVIVDRWMENLLRYNVHTVNGHRSPSEQGRSPGETKKKQVKKKPIGKKDISSEFPGARFLAGELAAEILH